MPTLERDAEPSLAELLLALGLGDLRRLMWPGLQAHGWARAPANLCMLLYVFIPTVTGTWTAARMSRPEASP